MFLSDLPSTASAASFVWHPNLPPARNQFVRFRRAFRLAEGDRVEGLSLFADSRFRLWINGHFVHAGPARFAPQEPEYDQPDISPWVKAGVNVMAVEVHHRGELTFQAVRRPGALWVSGQVTRVDGGIERLDTPDGWWTASAPSSDPEAPRFSFAIGAVERVDARRDQEAWRTAGRDGSEAWRPAATIDASPWGELRPRSIPLPSFAPQHPVSRRLCAPMLADEQVWSAGGFVSRTNGRDAVVVAWIHSRVARTVRAGLVNGTYGMNGCAVELGPKHSSITGLLERKNTRNGDPLRGSRRDADLPLRAGWNLFAGVVPSLNPHWALQVALPADVVPHRAPAADSPVGIFGSRDANAVRTFTEHWPARLNDVALSDGAGWFRLDQEAGVREIPSLRMAWDLPSEAVAPADKVAGFDVPLNARGEGMVVFDFGQSYVGHVCLEVTAAAGTVIDTAYDERVNAVGTLPLYRAHPGNHMADRYICRAGRQVYDGFHPRGGRYIQITVRRASGPVRLHHLVIRDRRGPLRVSGDFMSSDEQFVDIWQLCRRTVLESLDESWVDGWREHGVYLGDSVVQFAGSALLDFDGSARHLRRTLRLFALTQKPDGQMQPCAPAEFSTWHPDYTLWWGILLHRYWRSTGDLQTVKGSLATLKRIHASPFWQEGRTGLWTLTPIPPSTPGGTPFIDWGGELAGRWGEANLAMNALRVSFLQCYSEMAAAVGESEPAAALERERTRVVDALRTHVWDPEAGCFAANLEGGQRRHLCSPHGNVLALAAGVPAPAERSRLIAYLVEKCRTNAGLALQGSEYAGHMELFFCHFALEELGEAGCAKAAEHLIRSMWGPHREHDARACWEALARGAPWGVGSVCHSWSVAPMVYFGRHVLGVQWDFVAEPGVVHVRPLPGSLSEACGAVSLPGGGLVRVAWQRTTADQIEVQTEIEGDYIVRVAPRCSHEADSLQPPDSSSRPGRLMTTPLNVLSEAWWPGGKAAAIHPAPNAAAPAPRSEDQPAGQAG